MFLINIFSIIFVASALSSFIIYKKIKNKEKAKKIIKFIVFGFFGKFFHNYSNLFIFRNKHIWNSFKLYWKKFTLYKKRKIYSNKIFNNYKCYDRYDFYFTINE